MYVKFNKVTYDCTTYCYTKNFKEEIKMLNIISVNDVIIFKDKLFENIPKVVVTNANNLEDRNDT